MAKIIVVDDEQHIRSLISLYLKDEGFTIIEKNSALDALVYLNKHSVDCIITDIMMPGMDGYAFIQEVRNFSMVPMLMISAKSEQFDIIQGFQAGTDDYLTKPFDPVEMVFRVKSLLRRSNVALNQQAKLADFIIDRTTYTLSNATHSEVLPPKEFELLFLFATNISKVFTRDHLIEKIWGYEYEGTDRTVDVRIRNIRERLQRLHIPYEIQTMRNIGYRLGAIHE